MNQASRSHSTSRAFAFSCILLFCAASFAADYSQSQRHLKTLNLPPGPSNSLRVALFERNDLARAEKLAARETAHAPRDPEAWFLAMEAANASNARAEALRDAVKLCRFAKPADPRAA